MARILRVNNSDGDPIKTAMSVFSLKRLLKSIPPGLYYIDEISPEPLPSGDTSRRWGIAVKRGDSSVSIARDLWPKAASRTCDDRSTCP